MSFFLGSWGMNRSAEQQIERDEIVPNVGIEIVLGTGIEIGVTNAICLSRATIHSH